MTNPTVIVEKNDALIAGVETEVYVIDWSAEGSPSAADTFVNIKGESTDISASVLTGSESISGTQVTCPALAPLAAHKGKIYVVTVTATFGSRVRGAQFEVPIVAKEKGG